VGSDIQETTKKRKEKIVKYYQIPSFANGRRGRWRRRGACSEGGTKARFCKGWKTQWRGFDVEREVAGEGLHRKGDATSAEEKGAH